jgi:hypothetical protein
MKLCVKTCTDEALTCLTMIVGVDLSCFQETVKFQSL